MLEYERVKQKALFANCQSSEQNPPVDGLAHHINIPQ